MHKTRTHAHKQAQREREHIGLNGKSGPTCCLLWPYDFEKFLCDESIWLALGAHSSKTGKTLLLDKSVKLLESFLIFGAFYCFTMSVISLVNC